MASGPFLDLPTDRRRRERLIRDHLGGFDPRTRAAMRAVPRHWFIDDRTQAYADTPLPIGCDQTISQPFVVATMLAALDVRAGMTVLDVGSGSGYVSALLAWLAGPDGQVHARERHAALVAASAPAIAAVRAAIGGAVVDLACGDGFTGLSERAPFDRIHVGCSPATVPSILLDQLSPGGRLVLPIGPAGAQRLVCCTRDANGRTTERHLLDVRFVPMLPGTVG
jgi:protein-L-isoaspartate(D-aspartate) O-methyltransferase